MFVFANRARCSAHVALVLAVFSVAQGACGSTAPSPSAGDTPVPSLDAGPTGAPGEGGASSEGGVVDASPAPPGPTASVTVTSSTGPMAGIDVYFHDVDGNVLETKKTGVDGKATRVLSGPGLDSVTVVMNPPGMANPGRLFTVMALDAGDDIHIPYPEAQTYAVVKPTLTNLVGANGYQDFAGGCTAGSGFNVIPDMELYEACRDQAKFPLLVVASGGQLSTPMAFTFLRGLSFTNQTRYEPAMPAWSTALGSTNIKISNMSMNSAGPQIALAHAADGVLTYLQEKDVYATSEATFTTYPDFADALQAEAGVRDGGSSFRSIAQRDGTKPAHVTFDLAQLLPVVSVPQLSGAPPALSLAWSAASASPDVVAIMARITFRCDWSIVAPPSMTKLTGPNISGSTSVCFGDSTPVKALVATLAATALPDYSAARAHAAKLVPLHADSARSVGLLPALPIDGLYRYSLNATF